MMKTGLTIIIVWCSLYVFAHGDVHERILIASEALAADLENPELYVKRGLLYLEDEDYENTVSDLERSKLLAGEDFLPMLMGYAKMYHQLGTPDVALKYIDRFLELKPVHVLAFKTKAAILESMGDADGAIDYRKKVIVYTSTPLPENYFSLIGHLKKQERYDEAVFYCEAAMRKLGKLLVFELELIDIHQAAGNYKAALDMLDGIIDRSERKEKWYVQKAQILAESMDLSGAEKHLVMAEASVRNLPERLRNTPAMQHLMENIHAERTRLQSLTQLDKPTQRNPN